MLKALLEKALAELVPHIQVIGEEACADSHPAQLDDMFFLLDPLDGTRDFVAKRDNFTVNIGLVHNHYPIAGVIYAPVHEKLYFSGADCAHRLQIAPDGNLDIQAAEKLTTEKIDPRGVHIIASLSHRGEQTDQMIASLNVKSTIAAASSYKFCLWPKARPIFTRAMAAPWNGTRPPDKPFWKRQAALSPLKRRALFLWQAGARPR